MTKDAAPHNSSQKVLIAGAGIGGLTAALCCYARGLEPLVFERATALENVGAGIQLSPNAMRVFEALGLADKLAEDAFAPQALQARLGADGRKVFSVPITEPSSAEPLWGAPYLNIHRTDFIAVLKAALLERAPNSLRLGAAVKGYENLDGAIELSFEDGTAVRGDVLIGADGIHSAVRTQMHGADKARFTGNAAWRAVVPTEGIGVDLPNASCVWFGRGAHVVTYPLHGGELTNFVGVVEREDWTQESWTQRGDKSEALADFKGWDPRIEAVIKAAPETELYRWALYDRAPLDKWSEGRAVLLGDAAHAMLPFMAQGAAMAAEDAYVLVRELSGAKDVKDALGRYQAKRHTRTSAVQAASRANMKTFHKRSALAQITAYGPMWLAGSYAPSLIRRRLDRFYAYDVTTD